MQGGRSLHDGSPNGGPRRAFALPAESPHELNLTRAPRLRLLAPPVCSLLGQDFPTYSDLVVLQTQYSHRRHLPTCQNRMVHQAIHPHQSNPAQAGWVFALPGVAPHEQDWAIAAAVSLSALQVGDLPEQDRPAAAGAHVCVYRLAGHPPGPEAVTAGGFWGKMSATLL